MLLIFWQLALIDVRVDIHNALYIFVLFEVIILVLIISGGLRGGVVGLVDVHLLLGTNLLDCKFNSSYF